MNQTIRHELTHVWQYQHRGETVELPNGSTVQDISPGHTGSWYEWGSLMQIQRTNHYYERAPADFNYRIWCASCHSFVAGRHRLCKTVTHHAETTRGQGWCCDCDENGTDDSTFVVTDKDDSFHDDRQPHRDW